MSRLQSILCALIVPVFFIAGCTGNQTGKNMWRGITTPYNKYINTPARLSLDNKEHCEPYQITLSKSMADVDYLLDQLLRAMDDSDRTPDEEWIKKMFADFPWLGGIALTDGKGRVMTRAPEFGLKEFKVGPLLENDPRQRPMDLRAYVMESPIGPEVYVAKPVFLQEELRALIIAHFDMRALLAMAGNPENFVVYTASTVLWPSVYNWQQTPLAEADWSKLEASDTDGILKDNLGQFYWLGTYFANLRLFYATPIKGDFSTNPAQLDILRQAGSFTATRGLK